MKHRKPRPRPFLGKTGGYSPDGPPLKRLPKVPPGPASGAPGTGSKPGRYEE